MGERSGNCFLGGCDCGGTAPVTNLTTDLRALLAILKNPPLRLLRASDEEDTRASLSASEGTECATDGAAEHSRVLGGMLGGASWLEGPVVGDRAKDAVSVDIVPVVRCACLGRLHVR